MTDSEDPLLQKRIARLRQELADECGVTLPDDVLEELAYARFAEPHEGQRAAYGAVVPVGPGPVAGAGFPSLPSAAGFVDSRADLEVLRLCADGRTSFVMRVAGGRPVLAVDPAWRGSETSLAAYASSAGVAVIQRLASGRVRLFANDRVYSEEGGVWLARPTAARYHGHVASYLDPSHHATALAILELCVHTLSPAGHGATLVWFPEGVPPDRGFLDSSVAIAPPALSAADSSHAPAIAHALGQLDRAAILDSTGMLVHVNVTLTHADERAGLSFHGGTRHNSAGRYSASDGRGLVFVVSADGPVAVLQDGQVLASIATLE